LRAKESSLDVDIDVDVDVDVDVEEAALFTLHCLRMRTSQHITHSL
jgi:hypothetical protein